MLLMLHALMLFVAERRAMPDTLHLTPLCRCPALIRPHRFVAQH